MTERAKSGGWQQVWECPRCGQQIAAGAVDPRVPVALSEVYCGMGHERVEMEQKLVQAFDGPTPGEVNDAA